MDENDVTQVPQNEGNDSFLDGWEETGPIQEETDPGGADGKQAGAQEGGQAVGDGSGIHQDTGGTSSGKAKSEVSVSEKPIPIPKFYPREDLYGSEYGGSYPGGGQPGGAAQSESGGSGGEGLPPDGGGQGEGQPENGQQPPPPTPKTWTVDYMGQAVTVSESDVPSLAQRALDYDRVRSAYEEARPVMDLFRGFAQRAGVPVQEYIARIRTQAKQMEGLDEAAARRAVEMEDREARVSIQEAQDRARQEALRRNQDAQRRRQERVNTDVQEFINVFPEAARDFNSIPKEVWDAVNGGMSLVAAYARYNNAGAEARARTAAEEQRRKEAVQTQNAKNAAASAGSMKSAGNNHGPKDPFLEGWDE